MKKALFITANNWDTPYRVGSHELASFFAKNGWKVGFISDPVSPLHLLKLNNRVTRDRFKLYFSGGKKFINNNLWAYVPFTIIPPQNYPLLKSRFAYENWHRFSIPNIYKKLKKHDLEKVDLLYFDNAMQEFWINKIDFKKSVFRVADNYSGYDKYTVYTKILEEKLAAEVDLILYTAKTLGNYIENIKHNRSLYFPNGVNFEKFANGSNEEPADIKSLPHPRIVYIGEMEVRFDFELMKYAAKSLPKYSFVLIGNDIKAKKEFNGFKNVHLTGIKKSSELSKYLFNSDVGIIPFNVKKLGGLINYVNPIKMHQYFACGLPVVSARWKELENMNAPVKLYVGKEEFVEQLKSTVEEETDRNKLIENARKNDWRFRYEQLIDELGFNE